MTLPPSAGWQQSDDELPAPVFWHAALYTLDGDGTLTNNQSGVKYRRITKLAFTSPLPPTATGVMKAKPRLHRDHRLEKLYPRLYDEGIQKPFLAIFVWTVVFSLSLSF